MISESFRKIHTNGIQLRDFCILEQMFKPQDHWLCLMPSLNSVITSGNSLTDVLIT